MPNPIVQIRGLSKAYRRDSMAIPVLRDITLEVPEGEFLGLMGPSGSGKTTLLNLIAGIDRPDAGTVTVAGTDVTQLSESQLARWRSTHIGFVFQFYNLLPVLTAFENVELPLLLTSLSKSERKKNVETGLALVGLADRMHHYPRQLSGGQEQRVAIDPDTYFDLYPEFQLPPDQLAAFKKDRNACVIGRKLAQQHGFKLGDVITMEGDIYPGSWQWVVRGIYTGRDPSTDETQMFFQYAYLFEQVRAREPGRPVDPNFFALRIASPDAMAGVAKSVDALFENSRAPTKTE